MMLPIEIIFSPAAGEPLFQRTVPFYLGMTVQDALNQIEFYASFPEAQSFPVGVFSQKVMHDTLLSAGDRVEVYRPLRCNPKERRRKKALSARA